MNQFDILVVGGGHAGLEAVNIASQFDDVKVGLLTKSGVPVGSTPCNPAIGGVGKGQLVREIDLMGGLIGKLADSSAIQCRVLNESKGDAVKSTRFQVDKRVYESNALKFLKENSRVALVEGELISINKNRDEDGFVVLLASAEEVFAKKLIVTVGTFFDGTLHEGEKVSPGGRFGCKKSVSAKSIGLDIKLMSKKFKTGTPPRLLKSSVDTSKMEPQESDSKAQNFSFANSPFGRKLDQLPCYKAHTNKQTIETVLVNKDKSPMFNGQISGVGPRYCPSIEDKAHKYPEKTDHHVFVEPEGLELDTFYPNGISTSLPRKIQEEMVRSIVGLESAEIVVPGYAVEYDVVDTSRLNTSLESIDYQGLYFAGQVNGTSGYEEAAGQGLVAGLNAALCFLGRSQVVFPRRTSYLGVLIDDILSNKREEPYRLFTARAENRLYIREDNVVDRLGELRLSLGIHMPLDKKIRKHIREITAISAAYDLLPHSYQNKFAAKSSSVDANAFREFMMKEHGLVFDFRVIQEFLITKKYEGYIKRQDTSIKRFEKLDSRKIDPVSIVENLPISNECKELISKYKPTTFFHLKKITGIRPATLSLISSQV